MAYYLKPRGVSTGCCECSQHVGCECGGQTCAIECRSKADNAELCGYEEFGTPSSPAKKFRKKTISGTMYSGQWSIAGCPDATGAVAYNGSFTGGPDFWGDSSGSGAIEPIEIDAVNNRVKYRCTSLSFTPPSGLTTWGNLTALKIIATPVAGGAVEFTTVGQEEWLSRGAGANPHTVILAGNWTLAGYIGHTDTDEAIDVAQAIDRSVRDVWNITNEFANEPGCAPTETDLSVRYAKAYGEYPLNTGGDEEGWAGFAGTPLEGYGALAEITEQTSTARRTSGKADCQGAGPYQKAEEHIDEVLSVEDTEEDAYNRSAAGLEWNTTGPCKDHTTYITERGEVLGPYGFAYRIAQVRALSSNLTIGASYTVTFRIWRRAFDSTTPYAPYVELTASLDNVSATSGYTEWLDVPVERGYETRVMSCVCVPTA